MVDFFVTTDSVVATATVITDTASSRIIISWGDGDADVLRLPPGSLNLGQAITNPLPKGTYQFTHVYAESEDRMPFEETVELFSDDSADTRLDVITLTPRYLVNHFVASMYVTGDDGFTGGRFHEFTIVQSINGQDVMQWKKRPSAGFSGIRYQLPRSQVAREMTMADRPFPVTFHFTEYDLIWDDHYTVGASLHPSRETDGWIDTSTGGVGLRYYRQVRLIRTRPDGGPVFSAEPGVVNNPNA